MRKRQISLKLLSLSLVTAFFLASCNLLESSGPLASMTDTATVSPNQEAYTATDTPVPVASDTPIPTVAATDTSTPTARVSQQVIPTVNANCRKGPDTAYHQVTVLDQGIAYNVIGKYGQDNQNIWWHVQGRGAIVCWVSDVNVTRQGPVEQAFIDPAPPLPGMPSKFYNSYVCNPTTDTLSVTLTWAKAVGVTGYNIYRNDKLLVALKANADFFNENAPLGVALVYDLEAFNDYGVAALISSNVPACKK
jgi:hypothetical protein